MTESSSTYTILEFKGAEVPSEYHSFILSNWLRTLRFGNPVFKQIESLIFYKNYEFNLKRTLRNPDCMVKLAVLTEDPDIVLGFAVFRKNILDYIFVKRDMRRIGIGAALLTEGIDTFTHYTNTGGLIWRQKFKEWKFNPHT